MALGVFEDDESRELVEVDPGGLLISKFFISKSLIRLKNRVFFKTNVVRWVFEDVESIEVVDVYP